MGHIQNGSFFSSYKGDQIDALLGAMAQANPLPSGTDWVAFIDDCREAQEAAEAAAASVVGAEETCAQSASSASDSANAAHEDADRAEEAAAHVDLPVKRGEGYNSLVVGNTEVNTATNPNCFSCGDGTATTASNAFAGGKDSTATASEGFAFGNDAHSGHSRSTVFGQGTYSSRVNQLVFGRYNEYENTENCVEIVGYGMGLGRRANIRTLDTSGNETLAGKLTLGALPADDMDAVPLVMARPTLLWTNQNVGSGATFAAQTLAVDASDYNRLHIVYYIAGGNTGVFDAIVFADGKNHNIQTFGLPQSGAAVGYFRTVSVINGEISFSTCNVKELPSGARTTSNSYIIPYRIYGLI